MRTPILWQSLKSRWLSLKPRWLSLSKTPFFIIILLLLTSCSQKPQEKFIDSKILYSSWVEFHQRKDEATCRDFIHNLENFQIDNFNSYPELKTAAKNQLETCKTEAQNILVILSDGTRLDDADIDQSIQKIDLAMLAYLRNQNYALEDTHNTFYQYFIMYIVSFAIGAVILIFLNAREIKKRDRVISESETFLRHTMEVQEAERRRISRELHDTVAQSMRYVSLLAENLKDKEAATKIINTQNQNIEDIRKLCYNLTPPAISGNEMIGALELLGNKIFGENGELELRIVAEESVDFSAWTDEQLMNIYRIVQEAFQNIKKHADAAEVTVLIKNTCHPKFDSGAPSDKMLKQVQHDKKMKLIITDDGCGMSREMVNQINSGLFEKTEKFHFGVRNIVERVQLLGGTVTYRSEPDCGTQITVDI